MNISVSRTNAALFAFLSMVTFLIINLPYRYVERDGRWIGTSVNRPDLLPIVDPRPEIAAGWPRTFWVRQETHSGLVEREYSNFKLFQNLAIALTVSALVYGFTQFRQARLEKSENLRKTKARFDACLVGCVCATPAVFLSIAGTVAQRHQGLATRIVNRGDCYLSTSLPEPIASRVPSGVSRLFDRVRAAALLKPDEAIVRDLVSLSTLRALDIHGDDYSQHSLNRLAGHPELASIGLHRRDLTVDSLKFLGTLSRLVQLDLNESNVRREHLIALKPLREIRRLRLFDTPICLADLNAELLNSDEIVRLEVSRPPVGVEDELRIRQWPSLQQLRIYRRSTVVNPAPLSLVISDCPELKKLDLDRFQKYSMTLKNLPRLIDIGEDVSDLLTYVRVRSSFPGLTWVSELDLENIPNLTRLECVVQDLESIRLKRMPSLEYIKLGAFNISTRGRTEPVEVDKERCQKLFDDLGECEGPTLVDVEILPLRGVRFDRFAKNSFVRGFHSNLTGVDFDQLRSLEPMKNLEDLRLGQCPLRKDQFDWLLATFPNLSHIDLDFYKSQELEISASRRLRRMSGSVIERPRIVKIVDSPKLTTELVLLNAPEKLEIRDARSLTGLTVQGPWPRDHVLQGLRNLQWFAGGGPELTNQTFRELKNCGRLDALTLACTSVTHDQLATIRDFPNLTILKLPGHSIDDDLVANWRRMTRLLHINLDDSDVDAETIRWAGKMPNLKSFSVNRVPLSRRARHLLKNLSDLREIRLADTGVTANNILPLLSNGSVERLDISGINVTDSLVGHIANAPILRSIRLDHALISRKQLKTIVD